MLRLAFIGTGWWGKELARAAQSLPEHIAIAGCSALTEQERDDFRASFGGKSYASYEAVLADPSVDAVLLATPHSLHWRQIVAAAEAKKHVFCEKPLTLTAETARRAIAACEEHGRTLAVGHNRRYSQVARTMKSMVDSGVCGKILHVEGNYSSGGALRLKPEQWRAQRDETPAGGIAPMAMHIIDTLTWILGPIARLVSINKKQVLTIAIDDTSATLFELESGVTGSLGSIFACPMSSYLRLYGTRANLEARDNFAELLIQPMAADEPMVQQRFAVDDTLALELRAFAESCATGAPFPVRPTEAMHNVAIMEAIAASGDRGNAWIEVGKPG